VNAAPGRLRLALWALAAALGSLEAFAGRQFMNPDGIAHLDIADAYRLHAHRCDGR